MVLAVEEQAKVVRELKAAKAPKEDIDMAVAELKRRKAALDALKASVEAASEKGAPEAAPSIEVDLSAHFESKLSLDHCPPNMSPRERFEMIRSVGEECIEAAELA